MINNRKWKRICIVGFGNHAQNKILPALLEAGFNNIYIITNDVLKKENYNQYSFFGSIDIAINKLDKSETLFIISSPPKYHDQQCIQILEYGFDVMVEKPALISLESLEYIKNLLLIHNSIFVEMFMYLENFSSKYLIGLIKKKINSINNIGINFTIPSVPKNTFRRESSFDDSLLLDIGCYPISFLNQIDSELQDGLSIKQVDKIDIYPLYQISKLESSIKVNIIIGCDLQYSNVINLSFNNATEISYTPFFYGRNSIRELLITSHNRIKIKRFNEPNSFIGLFTRERSSWLEDQDARLVSMSRTIKTLSKLSKDINM